MIDDRLLGFDVRECWLDPADRWDTASRESFLLRIDVPKPLSVDTLVWPSVFDTGQGIGLPPSEREKIQLAGLPVPPWIGPNAGLWENLTEMQQYLAAHWAAPRPHAVIAVSWFSDNGFRDAGPTGPYLDPVTPPVRDPDWPILGLDVADGSLLSGLSNCGRSPLEAAALRQQWRARVNTRHLFRTLRQASRFRDLANQAVPEHAPFFVYGLFLVEESG